MDPLHQIIVARGNIHLAAEHAGMTPSELSAYLAADPLSSATLGQQLRVLALLQVGDLLNQSALALSAALPSLEPYDISKTFVALVQLLQSLTQGDPTNNVNFFEVILKMLPPNARGAIQELMSVDASAGAGPTDLS